MICLSVDWPSWWTYIHDLPVRGLHCTTLTTQTPVVIEEGKILLANQLAIHAPDCKGQDIEMGDS
jgi:hypothetical protein